MQKTLTNNESDVVRLQSTSHSLEEALLYQIRELSKTDPLIGAKIGSKEIFQRLMAGMKKDGVVHIDSLLVALGSLAGYACQAGLRAQATAKGEPESSVLLVAGGTSDGRKYYFGEQLNKRLAESATSVWSLSAGAAQAAGCTIFPDLHEIFKRVSGAVGTADFGTPCFPAGHSSRDIPLNYVRAMWPVLLPIIQKFCPDPEHWSILLSLSIQEAIAAGKTVIEPHIALVLVIEAAIPMSKVDITAY